MSELLCDLGQCDHSPIRPPRESHHGEQVFSEKWAELMQRMPGMYDDYSTNVILQQILHAGDSLTQRMATVAASFVVWLGTNCGRGFIDTARRRAKEGMMREQAFIAEWAIENHRHTWMNSGFRVIEYILATPDCMINGQLKYCPDYSADDCEVIEKVAYWLGSSDGEAFIASCEKEISERLMAESIGEAVARRDFKTAKAILSRVAA